MLELKEWTEERDSVMLDRTKESFELSDYKQIKMVEIEDYKSQVLQEKTKYNHKYYSEQVKYLRDRELKIAYLNLQTPF